jgi:outer membrane protein
MKTPLQKPAMRHLSLALCAVLAGFAPSAPAQNLVELYRSARDYDATYQSARSLYQANLAKADQAKAGILPTAGLSAGVNRTNFENNNPVTDRSFNAQTTSVNASQPLYRPGNWATYEQGKQQVELSKAQLEAAEQDLIVRTSQTYFDVLAAQDTLAFVRAQKAADRRRERFARQKNRAGPAGWQTRRAAPRPAGTGRTAAAGARRCQHLGAAVRSCAPHHQAGSSQPGSRQT